MRLIETMRWDGHVIVRRDLHLARLGASAAALGFRHDPLVVAQALAVVAGPEPRRLRLTLDRGGAVELTQAALAPAADRWRIALASEALDAADPRLRHKSTDRALHDRWRGALPPGMDEIVFANREGRMAEGTISNLFFDLGQGLCTPPLADGCLPGCLRAELLASGACREAPLSRVDLARARLWCGNSLRGLIAADFAGAA